MQKLTVQVSNQTWQSFRKRKSRQPRRNGRTWFYTVRGQGQGRARTLMVWPSPHGVKGGHILLGPTRVDPARSYNLPQAANDDDINELRRPPMTNLDDDDVVTSSSIHHSTPTVTVIDDDDNYYASSHHHTTPHLPTLATK